MANKLTYVDSFHDIAIFYDGKSFNNKFDKKSFIGSRVSYNDVILHSFKVSKTTSDDELKIDVEIKMYDDAGLDLQKRYKIAYIKKELDFEDNFLVEAFAIEIDSVKENLSSVLSRTKHIDFLALPFLSFTTLYKNKIIEKKSDLFIYIDEHEAFLSLYKNGEYLFTKSLINLTEMIKKLAAAGIDMTIDELKEHLFTKGLNSSMYERGETTLFNELESLFLAMFTKVNDIVIYNRSIFGFEKIDRIFLSMQNRRIKGVREFIYNFGMNEVEVRDFNLFRDKEGGNFFEKIVTSYIYDKIEERDFRHNLTLFQKEPAFYKKESGKVIIAASCIVLSSLLYIGFIQYENMELEKQKKILQERYDIVKKTQARYKKEIANIKNELKNILKKREEIKKRIQNIEATIDRLQSIRDAKSSYSSFIFDVNRLLKKYTLSTTMISMDSKDKMTIEIIAKQNRRDNIAKFMKDLMDSGFVGITTDEIKSNKDTYISTIEIKR